MWAFGCGVQGVGSGVATLKIPFYMDTLEKHSVTVQPRTQIIGL